jgi:hypothetical protein
VVTFEVPRSHEQDVDFNIARFLYDSKTGFTGEGSATTYFHGNAFSFGLVSDGDTQLERFAGIRAGFERRNLWHDRLGVRFSFASYHDQWNAATISSSPDEIYRTREVYEPEAMLALTSALELDFGVRISRYRLAAPVANTESSNAVVSTLRYHRRWGSDVRKDTEEWRQEVNASYSLESATRVFNSDPSYTKQSAQAHYKVRHGHSRLELSALVGRIAGLAPLFDRFVLGNASTLRGWNKFDLDPRGGSHVAHGSIEYGYHWFEVFYDTGAIWDRAQDREQKQSLGAGIKTKEGFELAVACPIRSGQATPVFIAGMNF